MELCKAGDKIPERKNMKLLKTLLQRFVNLLQPVHGLTWRWEDRVLVEEGVGLRGHWPCRVSVEVWRRRGRGVASVVGQVHEGLSKTRQ